MKKPSRLVLIVLLPAILVGCTLPTYKVYTQTFSETTTGEISRFFENNGNVVGAGPTVAAAYICKYAIGLPPVAAVCGTLVAAAYLRIQDVLGQIKRSYTQKCLKLEYHLAAVPFVVGFVNVFAAECLGLPFVNGNSAWSYNGKTLVLHDGGFIGGGGSSW